MTLNTRFCAMPRRLCRLIVASLFSLSLIACGGSSDSEPQANDTPLAEQQTKLLVSLTDAEGDFLTYQVDVTNITMTRANGAVVNLLPQTTSVDFAQYVEVTELLTILDAPAGRYDSAAMTLDFSAAQITVQDDMGNPISAAALDDNGDPLGSTEVEIQFTDNDGFVLTPGIPAQVTLDFDLDASNDIVIDGDTATVTVKPVLIADTILEEPKPFRLRGLLAQVDIDNEEFDMALRPFRVRTGDFGVATVHTVDDTSFEIDGVMYGSEEGLLALAAQDTGTAVITEGFWDRDAREYIADVVYAGSSVPWEQADILRGTVVARELNTLTVRGAILQLAEGSFIFDDDVTVQISDNTTVTRRGDNEAGIEHISVGSAIYATGEVSEDLLDASEGIVRILPSSVAGTVVSASPLAMDLTLINGRRPMIYNFAGTGTSADTDADPEIYELFTGTLDLAGINPGDPVRSRGYVSDFGTAPEDFIATTVINAAEVRGHMVVNYGAGSETAVVSADDNGIQLDLSDAPHRHHMLLAGIAIDMKELDQTPLVVPGGERGVYTIWINRRLEVYTFYDIFVAALSNRLDRGASVARFDAHGYYDGGMMTFSSKRIGVMLNN